MNNVSKTSTAKHSNTFEKSNSFLQNSGCFCVHIELAFPCVNDPEVFVALPLSSQQRRRGGRGGGDGGNRGGAEREFMNLEVS